MRVYFFHDDPVGIDFKEVLLFLMLKGSTYKTLRQFNRLKLCNHFLYKYC